MLDRHVIVDGVRLACRYTPGDSGETLVFLHGTPSHSFIWRHVIPPLEDRGHTVVAYDLLGYGASEHPRGRDTSVTAQAELLGALLAELDIHRCTLIGHDIGGAIAQLFAADNASRVDRLMLIDSVSYDSWPSHTWQEIIRHHLDDYAAMPQQDFEDMLARQLRMTVAEPEHMSGAVLDAYLAPHRTPLGRMSFFEHQVRHYDSTPTRQIAPRLKTLSMPTRILWGELDQWQPLTYGRRLAEDIPHAELVAIAGAGHFLMEDAADRVASEIRRLLTTASSASADHAVDRSAG
ncbi:alpha/beta hydrolase [Haloechinothrix sp. YIM 98757]|uniref:Alpha/beta hydrolase n=1 Tax=Haloechinothrix aidingensis TaxID=2752311 RepID=A0A838AB21_9PSEU|nr:alpha/beta hydrolase [Haloechinothrix aidingensis]MBA0126439.1 alpha/beta hydrolase [Haloechinothrix aidingensis]